MKPVKIFLFFISVLIIISVASWFYPVEKLNILGWEVRFFSIPLKQKISLLDDSVYERKDSLNWEDVKNNDSLLNIASLPKEKKLSNENNNTSNKLIFPTDSMANWNYLTEILDSASSGKPFRILYYGDSQIENDRITSAFRQKIQESYGGAGRGLMPVANIYNSANNFFMTVSDDWKRTSVVGSKRTNLDVGLLGESFKVISKHNNDSSTAWVKIKSIDPFKENGFTIVSIYYNAKSQSSITITINGQQQYIKPLSVTRHIKELRLNLGQTPEIIDLLFQTKTEITIYGISLETPSGMMIDNIALRGRSFPGFTLMDTIRFKQMGELIKPTFIILHYGVNIVPNIREEYGFYKDQLKQEIKCVKTFLPDIPVMLISASDMAHKVNGKMQSYNNINAVIKAQKEAALESGCAFWNLYESMGGEGTIIKWVEQQPPLGNKDYVHFTMSGAEKVGYLLYEEFQKMIDPGQENDLTANE